MRADTAISGPGSVALLVFDGLSLLEFSIAHDVFGPQSCLQPATPWYRRSVCGSAAVVRADGLSLRAEHGLERVVAADTVVVPPCDAPQGVDAATLDALREAHRRGARLISLCTGAFVLAAAGLLDGRRVATHWADAAELARRYPAVEVDPDVLYVDDGDVLTAAGSAASFDLCLHVVRQDCGAEIAAQLARHLVVPPYRDGGQAQFIATPLPPRHDATPFAACLAWAQAHLDEPLTVPGLAARATMSPRTFARRFEASTGTTPYRWLLRQRLQRAQELLETTALPVEAVAVRSGLGDAGNLRRHFVRALRTTPQRYRLTFSGAARADGPGDGDSRR